MRLLTECFILLGSAMFDANSNMVIRVTCQITIIFGTLKDISLKIYSLPLNNCFSHSNVLQDGVNVFSRKGFEKLDFLSENQYFVHFELYTI